MAIIVKPYTFVAGVTKSGEAAQVNSDLDTLYTEFNGNIDNANIKANAGIAQSKILNLTSDIAHLGWHLLNSQSASSSSSIDFTSTVVTSTYKMFMLLFTGVIPATDGAALLIRLSQSGTFLSGASDYQYVIQGLDTVGAALALADQSESGIVIADAIETVNASYSVNGSVYFSDLTAASLFKTTLSHVNEVRNTITAFGVWHGAGLLGANASACDGIRVIMSAGNIVSGLFRLYGSL